MSDNEKGEDQEIRSWLQLILPLHERLGSIVAATLEASIKKHGIEYLNITHRPKSENDAIEKIHRKEYSDPKRQLTDLSGIRVITYLEEHVIQIGNLIKRLFEVDVENSLDRSEILGLDRMGYRSTHFVCILGSARNALEEYEGLGALKFEIQVRTVLQHAWAELAHDRSFKFGFELPTKIQRKLNLFSGMLEVVDNAFDDIAKEIDNYKADIAHKTMLQISNVEIDSISLSKFMSELSSSLNIEIKGRPLRPVYDELREFGVSTIGDLEKLVTKKFIDAHKASYHSSSTTAGVVRRIMMFDDLEKYLDTKPAFSALASTTFDFLKKKYTAEQIKALLKKAGISILASK